MELTQVTRHSRFFYGWYIVFLSFLSYTISSGLTSFAVGVFMKPMIDELNWSRASISGVQSVGTVVMGVIGLFIGGIIDRHGGRTLMVFGAIVAGLGVMALSTMHEIWQFYLIRGLFITVGLTCMGSLVGNVAVSNWFIRKRGRATAYGAMGLPFAGMSIAPLAQIFIDNFGWRNAYVLLGIVIWLMMIAPAAILMRRRPEDMGLLPDGDLPGAPAKPLSAVQEAAKKADIKWTRREAMGTSTLWMIIVAFALVNSTTTGFVMHMVPFVSDMGFQGPMVAAALATYSATSLVSKVFWGLMIERIQGRWVGIMALGCMALGFSLIATMSSIEMILLAHFVLGVGIGGTTPIQEVVWANYYGRMTLGAIRSIGMPFSIIAGATGPLLAGMVYDNLGSYQVAFAVFMFSNIIALILMLLLRAPKPPRSALVGEV